MLHEKKWRSDVTARVRPRANSSDALISYRGVGQIFTDGDKDFVACSNINLDVHRGEFISVIGPSGCGKSTILNIAAGLLAPSVGEFTYDGKPQRGLNLKVGSCTQKDLLLPWRSTKRNVELALELQGVPKAERSRRAEKILAEMGLEGKGNRYPSQLSGGMLKRAALAQILVYEPETLLMDEPFGALDAQLRMALQRELIAICAKNKKTVIFVTHDLEEAILLGDRVIVFGANPGRIIHEEKINFKGPRDLMALRSDAEFGRIWQRLWQLLGPEIGDDS